MTLFITTSKETKNPVLYVNADGVIYTDPKVNVDSLRSVEKELVSFKNNETGKEYAVVFDMRKQTKLAAALGMGHIRRDDSPGLGIPGPNEDHI
jgi:hypothetical protein